MDSVCWRLDSKLCDFIYFQVAQMYCHIRRSEPDQKLSSYLMIYENSTSINQNGAFTYITSNLIFEAHVIRKLNS